MRRPNPPLAALQQHNDDQHQGQFITKNAGSNQEKPAIVAESPAQYE